MKKVVLALAALMALAIPAYAQSVPSLATVVATCGTPPNTYGANQNRPVTQDTTGKACVNATVSASNASVGTNATTAPTSSTQIGAQDSSGNLQAVSASNPLPISGSITASLAGFTPNGNVATRAVTTASSNVALPSGTTVAVSNTGSVAASIKLSVGAGSAATTDFQLQSGATVGLTVGANTFINAITASGSTSLSIAGGTGLVSGYGGGGASTSGGVAQGSTTSGQLGNLTQGAVTTSAPTYTTGQTSPLSLDTSGNLRVNVASATGVAQASTTSGQTVSPVGYRTLTAAPTDTTATTNIPRLYTDGAQVVDGAMSSGNPLGIIQADASAAINISTATTTQLVALSSGKKIYVTSYDFIAGGTGNITLEYGTGTSCGTGTTILTGAYNLTAQAGVAKGNGLGPVLVIPTSNALCALTSAAVQMSGSVAYTQQ